MDFAQLKNANMLNNEDVEFSRIQMRRLASEKKSDGAYLQIHRVTFLKKDLSRLTVLTENLTSHAECSEGPVTVYVVTDVLGEVEH